MEDHMRDALGENLGFEQIRWGERAWIGGSVLLVSEGGELGPVDHSNAKRLDDLGGWRGTKLLSPQQEKGKKVVGGRAREAGVNLVNGDASQLLEPEGQAPGH